MICQIPSAPNNFGRYAQKHMCSMRYGNTSIFSKNVKGCILVQFKVNNVFLVDCKNLNLSWYGHVVFTTKH